MGHPVFLGKIFLTQRFLLPQKKLLTKVIFEIAQTDVKLKKQTIPNHAIIPMYNHQI